MTYDAIIENSKSRILTGYKEKHHIIPRCMGGSDDSSNLATLTAKEHYIAHRLLVKIYPDNYKLKFALNFMVVGTCNQERYTPNCYEAVKIANSVALSELHRNRKRSPESSKKISEALKGRVVSKETRELQSKIRKEKPNLSQKGTKKPGVGGRKKGFKGVYRGDRAKQRATLLKNNAPSYNVSGYEILTPSGFQPFHGVDYSGLVFTLKFTLEDETEIIVSKKHRFESDKIAKDYIIGDTLSTANGTKKIIKIENAGKKQVFDILEVSGGHLYYGNNVVHHNCQFITDEDSAVIPEASEENMEIIVKEHKRPSFFDCYVSMDIGFKDLTVVLLGYYDFRAGTTVIEDEIVIKGKEVTTSKLAALITEKEQFLWGFKKPYLRVADNNNLILLNELSSDFSLPIIPTAKDNKEAAINNVRIAVADHRMRINPRCKTLIFHLKNATWNKNRTSYERTPDGGHSDGLDALIYLMRNIQVSKNPYPYNFDYTEGDYFNVDSNRKNPFETHLTKMFNPNKKG